MFDVGHTADISAWVEDLCPIKGLLFSKLISFEFEERCYGVLLCVGVTREELDFAREHGSGLLLDRLKVTGIFPLTDPERSSVI